MIWNILLVVLAGGIGSAARYLFSIWAAKWLGTGFAWGTLGVNLIGCLLIGFVYSLAEKSVISPSVRLCVMTGFVGGLTTFSTFALESANYFRNGELLLGLANLAANDLGGLLLVVIGIWLGRLI